MNSVIKTMRRVGELLKLDCGDNGCWFKANGSGGMRTNGGCSCELVAVIERLIAKAAVCDAFMSQLADDERWLPDPKDWDAFRGRLDEPVTVAVAALRELESKP